MLLLSAPMAGITDKPFRLILRKFTSLDLYTEMLGISTLYHNHPQTLKMLKISDEKDIIVQLVGIEEKYMIHAAKMSCFYGAKAIDINMGCPVKKLIANGSGAALLKTPDTAARLVEAVKNAVDVPVFVKTRIGWDLNNITVASFAKRMQEAGADRITVHGRTKEAGYAGPVHQDVIALVKKSVSIPVIANGDVTSYQTAQSMIKNTQADGVMVARGLLGRPWLLNEIQQKQIPDFKLADIILEHLDLMLAYYQKAGLPAMRKHLAWYATGFEGKASFCNQVFAEKEVDKVKKIIKDFFNDIKIKETK